VTGFVNPGVGEFVEDANRPPLRDTPSHRRGAIVRFGFWRTSLSAFDAQRAVLKERTCDAESVRQYRAGAIDPTRDAVSNPLLTVLGDHVTEAEVLTNIAAHRSAYDPIGHVPQLIAHWVEIDESDESELGKAYLVTAEVPSDRWHESTQGELDLEVLCALIPASGHLLGRLHRDGIVHGDVSLGNLRRLRAEPGVVLLDFGASILPNRSSRGIIPYSTDTGDTSALRDGTKSIRTDITEWLRAVHILVAGGQINADGILERDLRRRVEEHRPDLGDAFAGVLHRALERGDHADGAAELARWFHLTLPRAGATVTETVRRISSEVRAEQAANPDEATAVLQNLVAWVTRARRGSHDLQHPVAREPGAWLEAIVLHVEHARAHPHPIGMRADAATWLVSVVQSRQFTTEVEAYTGDEERRLRAAMAELWPEVSRLDRSDAAQVRDALDAALPGIAYASSSDRRHARFLDDAWLAMLHECTTATTLADKTYAIGVDGEGFDIIFSVKKGHITRMTRGTAKSSTARVDASRDELREAWLAGQPASPDPILALGGALPDPAIIRSFTRKERLHVARLTRTARRAGHGLRKSGTMLRGNGRQAYRTLRKVLLGTVFGAAVATVVGGAMTQWFAFVWAPNPLIFLLFFGGGGCIIFQILTLYAPTTEEGQREDLMLGTSLPLLAAAGLVALDGRLWPLTKTDTLAVPFALIAARALIDALARGMRFRQPIRTLVTVASVVMLAFGTFTLEIGSTGWADVHNRSAARLVASYAPPVLRPEHLFALDDTTIAIDGAEQKLHVGHMGTPNPAALSGYLRALDHSKPPLELTVRNGYANVAVNDTRLVRFSVEISVNNVTDTDLENLDTRLVLAVAFDRTDQNFLVDDGSNQYGYSALPHNRDWKTSTGQTSVVDVSFIPLQFVYQFTDVLGARGAPAFRLRAHKASPLLLGYGFFTLYAAEYPERVLGITLLSKPLSDYPAKANDDPSTAPHVVPPSDVTFLGPTGREAYTTQFELHNPAGNVYDTFPHDASNWLADHTNIDQTLL
jgi:hypothetical protein